MQVVLTEVPDAVTAEVVTACASRSLSERPDFVCIEPAADAVANRCIHNVQRAASRGEGDVVVGWKIMTWPRVLAQFIGHAVLGRDGQRVCITPDLHGETRVLFVADPSITFDSNDPSARMPSFYHPIDRHPDVAAFIRVEGELHVIKTKFPVGSGPLALHGADAELMKRLRVQQVRLIREIALRTRKPNERCLCDSGRKFKKCCHGAMARARQAELG